MKPIARVAVMGAGVMGAQLAAHLINQGIPVRLFDLPSDKGARNERTQQAIAHLSAIKPPPLVDPGRAMLIQACNIDDDLAQLADCDLVIEAIGERIDWKEALFSRIVPHMAPDTWLVSNTSGLSLTAMAKTLPEERRPLFCGLHFFNPPRYMTLVELIRTPWTDETAIPRLWEFVNSRLGKNVVFACDTPNFIANRIGVAATVFAFYHAQRLGLSCALVDELTGTRLGHPRSATYRTADVVGLDILAHVIDTTYRQAMDDPFRHCFAPNPRLQQLIANGSLGAKTGRGFYRKEGKTILQWDAEKGEYIATGETPDAKVLVCLTASPPERLIRLRQLDHPQAQFLWAIHRDLFHYCAHHLSTIANFAMDVDLALRWGFGWNLGPFEVWQMSGWQTVAQAIEADRQQGVTLSDQPLPAWALNPECRGVHKPDESWSAQKETWVIPRGVPRQRIPTFLIGMGKPESVGTTIQESGAARLWTLDDEVLIFSLRTKMNTLGETALEAMDQALEQASLRGLPLVLWSPAAHFSAGGDLAGFIQTYTQHGLNGLNQAQRRFQDIIQRLRSSPVPTVAALQGFALGGGCEVALHCDRRVAHTETNMGLVEVNVGLFPGAGGLTEMARRAGCRALDDGLPLQVGDYLKADLSRILRCEVSGSAQEAKRWGWLDVGDVIVPHAGELLHVALSQARALVEASYGAPLVYPVPVAGIEGRAQVLSALINAHQGGQLSDHDLFIGRTLAQVACGGDLPAGTLVPVEYLLALEREQFGPLLATPKSRERIMSFLETGKAVRN